MSLYRRHLDPTAYRVWAAIPAKGRITPQQLAADAGLPEDMVMRVLFVLTKKSVADVLVWYEDHDPPIEVERRAGRDATLGRADGHSGPLEGKPDRNRRVAERWDQGATFAEIAREFGFSTSRAREIITKHRQRWDAEQRRWVLPTRPSAS